MASSLRGRLVIVSAVRIEGDATNARREVNFFLINKIQLVLETLFDAAKFRELMRDEKFARLSDDLKTRIKFK